MFDIGYQTIYLFTIKFDNPNLETLFYSKDIRLIILLATERPNSILYWTSLGFDKSFVLEDEGLEFILDDFQEDLIILIDNLPILLN